MHTWTHPVLLRLVDHQGGAVSRSQLLSLGLTRHVIEVALRTGRLVRVHRGVYAFGRAPLGERGRRFAALLAAGDGAVLARRSAAALHGLRPEAPESLVEVATARQLRIDTLRALRHRLHPEDVTRRAGIPVTTVERTLVDLADVLPVRELERAYDTARVLRILRPAALDAALDRSFGRRGAPRLREVVEADRPPALTNGPLEERLLELVRAAGLPDPEVNVRVNGHLVDFAWPEARLIVETDGRTTHGTRRGRRRDRERDADHRRAGWTVLRLTYDDLRDDPQGVIARIADLLGA